MIYTILVHQLASCEMKSCVILHLNSLLLAKILILNPKECSSSKKVHLLLSSHIKIHQYICLEVYLTVNGAWSVHVFVYYDSDNMMKRCLNSHSDGTHSVQKIHWWASDVILNFIKSVLLKKQTHQHGWPELFLYRKTNIIYVYNYKYTHTVLLESSGTV